MVTVRLCNCVISIVLVTTVCVASPALPARPTTTSPSTSTEHISTERTTPEHSGNTTVGDASCSAEGSCSVNRADLAKTIFLRLSIVAACICVFVGLVKLSVSMNRRCTCDLERKPTVNFTRI
ncbi:uncharacterized protein LOC124257082 [Haliotis rubra]|uniref:uncharacterized protein LOC124257082 n=1 Tax=Haliotis rubra TaxID=36100 RepID=UPI001EE5FE18|nr:uncharacterized protein LOC124257082 [Haliotis rubra]XP_046547021.1 uncharacterized protein LOC124257082 [Haliotis rubra]XP_046547022.1 uncharacterized protein LOC124257082 [Haliotis rubra]XP_046547023.1 uncharacterized protein LOC124257082 [Haliotis rubra]